MQSENKDVTGARFRASVDRDSSRKDRSDDAGADLRNDDCGRPGSLRTNLTVGHAEGTAYGAMVGLGETYLPAFALAAGLGEITAGMVASVPLLAGGLMQSISPRAVHLLGSYKRWVVVCAFVQAFSFIPLVVAALTGGISVPAVLLVATLYWGAGLATGPAWNTWMGALVPPSLRARFFARRTLLSQLTVALGFLGGGAILQWSKANGTPLLAFAGLFLAAALARFVSVWLLASQCEPETLFVNGKHVPFSRLWQAVFHSGSGQLLLYLVVVQGAVQIAGPFFTPFMFKKLHLSYSSYAILIAAAFLVKVLLLPACGRFAHRVGAIRLLWIGGVGIVPMSALWIVSDNFFWLLFVQMLAGAAWAAYELAFFLMFFESISEEERTNVLTVYNLAYTASWVLGSAFGALLLHGLGATHSAYLWLFGVSSIGRAVALVLLRRVPGAEVKVSNIGIRTIGVRPMAASIDSPILPSLPDQLLAPSEEACEVC